MKIILGSQSKQRKKILEEMGLDFEVMTADIDEKSIRHDDPKKLTMTIAKAKAEVLKSKINEPAILITADLVVVWNGKILEKPENEKEIREFLEGYNVYPIETVAAVVVTNLVTGKQVTGIDKTKIHFFPFSNQDIEEVIAKGDALHFAGGVTTDGELWHRHIKKIEGTRDSAMGLPRKLTEQLISEVMA